VSLVPSATESLVAWGVTPVAVTRFCEQPALRQVGGTKDPDVAAVVDLAPDLVVVCREENRLADADALRAAGLDLFVFAVDDVEDVEPQLAALAARLGVVVAPAEPLPPPAPVPVGRAFVPIWRRPWMTMSGACYGSSLLAHLGMTNVFADHPVRYPEVDLDSVAGRSPDVVLAPSEPYPFGPRHVVELEAVAPVVLIDGQDLFWWGVRTPGAARRLAEVVASLPLRRDT
jgi:ABC-type Fe3+-hydroxamate transport system substrate-binding protein